MKVKEKFILSLGKIGLEIFIKIKNVIKLLDRNIPKMYRVKRLVKESNTYIVYISVQENVEIYY